MRVAPGEGEWVCLGGYLDVGVGERREGSQVIQKESGRAPRAQ